MGAGEREDEGQQRQGKSTRASKWRSRQIAVVADPPGGAKAQNRAIALPSVREIILTHRGRPAIATDPAEIVPTDWSWVELWW
ncbi:MAG: hypothetical protein D6680_14265 [Cyanobacteria bacterium J007]|nr:MAG: hypothetical protein D6680_14265 [Cyanobacteria bacterium J007]